MPERLATVTELALVLALVGCGSSEPEPSTPSGPVTSSAGLYVGEFSFVPSPPQVGENHVTLHVEAQESPVVGATLALESYMPAHGHSPTDPLSVSEIGDGDYESSAIVYNMPGTWELTVEVAAGPGTDTFVLSYDVH